MNGFATVTEVLDDRTRIVSVEGELDMETAPNFETELLAAVASGANRVIVDLSGCGFLDSSALTVLVKANKHLDGAGPLSLVIAHGHVLKAFEITHLDGAFEIHRTRAEAVNPRTPAATSRNGNSEGTQRA